MPAQIVLFDLEFTAWEGSMERGWTLPHEHREIVQIGAVRLDAVTLEEVATLDLLVVPRINQRLSDYFVELTGITNDEVAARGRDFALAYPHFLAFAGDAPAGCFGRDDRVLMENLALYALSGLSRPPRVIDLRAWIVAQGVDLTGVHSGMVAAELGLVFTGRIHNALDDARSLASALRHFVAKGARPPWLKPPDSGSAQ